MNCHRNSKNKQNSHNHSPLKHMLHMVICCGLPLILVGLLPAISRLSPSASLVIGKITPFLCPLMMIFMIPMMIGNNKKSNCCDNKNADVDNKDLV